MPAVVNRARQANLTALATGAKPYLVPKSLKPRIRKAITAMVFDGLTRPEAAAAVGISDNWLYQQLKRPEALKHYKIECEVLRTGQRHKNIHKAIAIRDANESGRTSIEAMKFIEKDYDESSGNPRVNFNVLIQPGYICDISQHSVQAKQILQLSGAMKIDETDQ